MARACLLLAVATCGRPEERDPVGHVAMGAAGGGAGQTEIFAAGAPDTSETGGAGGALDAAGAGNSEYFAVDDIADTACEPTAAKAVPVTAAADSGLAFEELGVAGTRRVAFDNASLAFITFDPMTGASSDSAADSVVAVATDGETISALELDTDGALVLARYDADGAALGEVVALDSVEPQSTALAASSDGVLALWRQSERLLGRLWPADGSTAREVDLGPGSCVEPGCAALARYYAGHFVVAFSHALGSETAISWAAVDLDGTVVSDRTAFTSAERYRLAAAALFGEGALALLVAGESPSEAPLLLLLDAFGHAVSPAYRLLGARDPWGVAAQGRELAVVASSRENQAVFRVIAADGRALTAWRCVDDSGKNTAFSPMAALTAEAEGYGLVVRRTDGSNVYLATDERGD